MSLAPLNYNGPIGHTLVVRTIQDYNRTYQLDLRKAVSILPRIAPEVENSGMLDLHAWISQSQLYLDQDVEAVDLERAWRLLLKSMPKAHSQHQPPWELELELALAEKIESEKQFNPSSFPTFQNTLTLFLCLCDISLDCHSRALGRALFAFFKRYVAEISTAHPQEIVRWAEAVGHSYIADNQKWSALADLLRSEIFDYYAGEYELPAELATILEEMSQGLINRGSIHGWSYRGRSRLRTSMHYQLRHHHHHHHHPHLRRGYQHLVLGLPPWQNRLGGSSTVHRLERAIGGLAEGQDRLCHEVRHGRKTLHALVRAHQEQPMLGMLDPLGPYPEYLPIGYALDWH